MSVIDDRAPAAYTTTGSSFVTIPGSTLRTRMGGTGGLGITFTNTNTGSTAIVQVIASNDDPGTGNELDPSKQVCIVVDDTHVDGGGSAITLATSNVPQAVGFDHPHWPFYAVQAKDGTGHGVVKTHLVVRD